MKGLLSHDGDDSGHARADAHEVSRHADLPLSSGQRFEHPEGNG